MIEKIPVYEIPISKNENLLLHCCCAPCSGGIITSLLNQRILPIIFFYNPNIYPKSEYELRKETLMTFVVKNGLSFIDADYEDEKWFSLVKGKETLPERSERCSLCFDLRLQKTAEYALDNGLKSFATTLGISRWKDQNQVNRSGEKAAEHLNGSVTYLGINWRKNDGLSFGSEMAKREQFYIQEYCGCLYSLEQANQMRKMQNRPLIDRKNNE